MNERENAHIVENVKIHTNANDSESETVDDVPPAVIVQDQEGVLEGSSSYLDLS